MKRKVTLKKKLTVNYCISVSVIITVTFLVYFIIYDYDLKKQYQNQLMSLAKAGAKLINADDHETLKSIKDENSPNYLKIKKVLQAIKKANPDILFVYTMRKTGQKEILEFVVDAEDSNSEDFSHLGDKYNISQIEEIKKAFGEPTADNKIEEDQWGLTFSGYAPIRGSTNQTVAIIGVDMAAEKMVDHYKNLFFLAVGIFLGALFLTIITSNHIAKKINQPLKQIMVGINRIRSKNLNNFCLTVSTGDEFEEIGDALNNAAGIIIKHQEMMQRELRQANEEKAKIFKVYRDVIYAITQGRLNLISEQEMLKIYEAGELYQVFNLDSPEVIGKVRKSITECIIQTLNVPKINKNHIVLCVSEAATNAVKHAWGGMLQFRILNDRFRVIVNDQGPGMNYDTLPKMIFYDGFSTKVSLGYGFSLIYKFTDQIFLRTSNQGTFLALDFNYQSFEELPLDKDYLKKNA